MVGEAHRQPELPPKGQFFLAGRLFPRKVWWKDRNMRTLYLYILVLSFCNTANGFDNSMMNGLQAIKYWQTYFNHPSGSILGLMSCIMSVGAICGLTIIPFILDRYGRKPSLIGGAIIMVIGIVLQVASQTIGMFVAARFILGIGDIIVICTFPMLVTEIAPSQDRAVLVTLSTTTYNVGAFIAAWTTFGTFRINSNWSWRATSLLQLPFTLLLLVFIYWIPESPRYYMARDQPEKALSILAHYHANGDEQDEVVQLEYTEIATALALEKDANKFSFLDFVRTPGNRKRLIIIASMGLFSQWSGNALISYYLTPILANLGITSAQTQLGINAGLTSWNLITNVFLAFKVDSWGRRTLNLSGCAVMLSSFLIWTILSALDAKAGNSKSGMGIGIIVLIFIYYFGYALKFCSQASYTSEILPYHMRSKGYSIMEYGLYSVLFFNQFVDATAIENIHWRFYIVFVVFLVVETIIVYFFYVETRYVPLEEITKLFDGEDIAAITNAELENDEKGGAAVTVENA